MFLSIGKFLFHFPLQRYYFLPTPARKQAFNSGITRAVLSLKIAPMT
jgi:hypothetical protein